MTRKNLSILFILSVLFIIIGCDGDGFRKEIVNQMQINVANNEIQLDIINNWEPVGQTFVIMTTTDNSTLTCLFVAEAIGATAISGPYDSHILPYTQPLEVRILVDNEIADPKQASFTPPVVSAYLDHYSSHSFLAIKRNVPPGSHKILVEWNRPVNDPELSNPRMRNRTLTVFQSIKK